MTTIKATIKATVEVAVRKIEAARVKAMEAYKPKRGEPRSQSRNWLDSLRSLWCDEERDEDGNLTGNMTVEVVVWSHHSPIGHVCKEVVSALLTEDAKIKAEVTAEGDSTEGPCATITVSA